MSILKDLDPHYAKIHAPQKRFNWAALVGALSLLALVAWAVWQLSASPAPAKSEGETKLVSQSANVPSEEAVPPVEKNLSSNIEADKPVDEAAKPALIRALTSSDETPSAPFPNPDSQGQLEKGHSTEPRALPSSSLTETISSKPLPEPNKKKTNSDTAREKLSAKSSHKNKAKPDKSGTQQSAKKPAERDVDIITAIMR